MRFRRLRLIAFGHFSNVDIELGDAPALHVIYGPNEAGKSTALRAITGLLYGIPVRTTDDHLHGKRELRIGATLSHDGRWFEVVRRKGNDKTLFDGEGNLVAETLLASALGGVDEATFRAMFGLNHETLREGARGLLEGHGSVGESLFDAGLGGRGIQSVLADLRREADELYRPRGQRQAVNDALRRFKEAKELRATESVRPEAWALQVEHLERARAEHHTASEDRRRLKIEESALQRARSVIPLLTQRRDLLERRAALGDVATLTAEATPRRLKVQRLLEESARDQQRLQGEVDDLVGQLGALHVPQALADLDAEAVEAVYTRLGEYRKALIDLPKRAAELRAREAEVTRLATAVGLTADAADLERARLGLRSHGAIRRLAQSRAALDASAGDARTRLEERRAELGLLREREQLLPEPPDGLALRAAVEEARLVADVPARLAELDAEIATLRAALQDGERRLSPWPIDPAALASAALPSPETVDRFSRDMDRLAAARQDVERRRRELQDRLAKNEGDRAAAEAMGAPPTQADLRAARERRDALWSRIAAGTASSAALLVEFEEALRDADEIADRLYREADRVGAVARLRADAELLALQMDEIGREADGRATEEAELSGRWRDAWRSLGIEPAAPPEMRDWLARGAVVLRDFERMRQRVGEHQRLAERLAERQAALADALRAAGAEASGDSFAQLQRRAGDLCETWAEQSRQRDELTRTILALESEIARDARVLAERGEQAAAWTDEWSKAIAPLGLDAGVSPEEASIVLDGLGALVARVDDAEALRVRVAAIEADADSFRAEVARLVATGAPHLAGPDAADTAERLVREHRRVMEDVRSRRRLEDEVETRRAKLRALADDRRAAEAELQSLLAAARVSDLPSLEAAEKRSDEAVSLDAAIARLDEQLRAAGEGAAVEDLVAQTRGIDADGARARLYEIEEETQRLSEDLERLGEEIGSLKEGLARLENERGAANAAAAEQEALADLSAQVRRYVRVALAAEILDGEIERYRQRNQGPILTRANVFFPRLTLGSYSGLRVGYDADDRDVLRCVRADGIEVDVDSLSDGTRDQLYLALRLATLEHFAESHEPLPLILDDVFIHFDDRRTAAALEVLADLAATTQILLFTHHAHLVELARGAVPDDRRVEHDLGRLRGESEPRARDDSEPERGTRDRRGAGKKRAAARTGERRIEST